MAERRLFNGGFQERAGDLPRVERSLKHILEAGHSLLGKAGSGSDAKVPKYFLIEEHILFFLA